MGRVVSSLLFCSVCPRWLCVKFSHLVRSVGPISIQVLPRATVIQVQGDSTHLTPEVEGSILPCVHPSVRPVFDSPCKCPLPPSSLLPSVAWPFVRHTLKCHRPRAVPSRSVRPSIPFPEEQSPFLLRPPLHIYCEFKCAGAAGRRRRAV